MSSQIIKAWHFTAETLRTGSPIPPVGEWSRYEGEIIPCSAGLHASRRLIDALQYAPGSVLHYVSMRGELVEHGKPVDKLVARERRIEWTIPAEVMEPILRRFARWCALQVIHLWDAPDDVVRRYLETGDESIRAATRAATRAAAMAAAGDAAEAAAWDAAGDGQERELQRLVQVARRQMKGGDEG